MRDISLISPTVGLSSIRRFEADRTILPSQSDARLTGKQIRQSVRTLYDQTTLKDVALDLTVPSSIDSDLLQPQKFEAALLDAVDKVEADAGSDPAISQKAHAVLRDIRAAWQQCRYNMSALNQA